MKKTYLLLLSALISSTACAQVMATSQTPPGDLVPFQLISTDMTDGATLANLYVYDQAGCAGSNKSPTLSWSYPPEGTKSFAVTMFDKTANNGNGWLHWAVFNIPADESILRRGAGTPNNPLPKGANALPNSWGHAGYDGPCPPVGKPHTYEFTVYALPNEKIEYPLNAIGWATLNWLEDFAMAKATVTTTYQRTVP